jgi:predicted RNA-binding Zn-ribbon protein involved in translation (DUF1610 family)
MTTFRTTCSTCGDVELIPSNLALELAPSTDSGQYRFDCPFCGQTEKRPASQRVVNVLLAAGVGYDVVDDFSPITQDEITFFQDAIENENWASHLTV